ncbi:MAG: hypothetical protein QM654_13655 [Dysgonamonadaceae bacterium]
MKDGKINRIQFVQESEIVSMLSKTGVFTEGNKVANAVSRYGYISKGGKSGGKFDFSYNKKTGIPAQYTDASSFPLNKPSPMLFLVTINSEGYATAIADPWYCYFYRDHLGSIRAVWKHSSYNDEFAQVTQYYPSGLPWWSGRMPET